MSLNLFWFLPTHGDGHYLGTEKASRPVDHGYLQQIAQAADRIGFSGVLIPTGALLRRRLAGRRFAHPGYPAAEIPGGVAPERDLPDRGGASGGDTGQALQRTGAV